MDGEPYLWLEQAGAGPYRPIAGAAFVEAITQIKTRPLLVVLAACQGAGTSYAALGAVGPLLARTGVGAVLAMREEVPQATVAALLPTLFVELRRDGEIDRAPAAVAPPPPADQSSLTAALADQAAAQAGQAAERETLRLRQEQAATEALRRRDEAALALDQLQPRHEREQAERQHAVDAAAQELAAAQAALTIASKDNRPRAEGAVRDAQTVQTKALDAQARMRTEQGVEREQLAAELAQAQGDLDTLPTRQASERVALEGRLAADLARAQGRADAARQALAANSAQTRDAVAHVAATAQVQAQASATAAAQGWQERDAARLAPTLPPSQPPPRPCQPPPPARPSAR